MTLLAPLVQILLSATSLFALSRDLGCASVALSVIAYLMCAFVNALARASIRADLPSLPYVGGFDRKANEEELDRRAELKKSVADRLERFNRNAGGIAGIYFLALFALLVAQSAK